LEKEQSAEPSNDNNLDIGISDSIEILTTDDERLKTIGEELANETGRAILTKLFEGTTNISKIATELNVSIALVSWHIQRLEKAKMVRVSNVEFSSKNKKVYHYIPSKFAFIIIPKQITKPNFESKIVKASLKKLYDGLLSLGVFAGSSALIYFVQKLLNPIRVIVTDPDQINSINMNSEILITVLSGAVVTLAFLVFYLNRKLKK